MGGFKFERERVPECLFSCAYFFFVGREERDCITYLRVAPRDSRSREGTVITALTVQQCSLLRSRH